MKKHRGRLFELLETRVHLSANPVTPPAGSAPLLGSVIGTAGSYRSQGNVASKALDGNISTYFDAPTASGAWVGENLGSPQEITQVQYVPRSGFASRMVGGVFQGSNTPDFSSGVETLYTITAAPASNVYTAMPVTNTDTFQYVRYLSPVNGDCNVAELEFDGYSPMPATAAPGVPSQLEAIGDTATDVTLAWTPDPSQPATSFTIERQGPTDSGPVIIGSVNGSISTYDDKNVLPNTTYSYAVFASNSFGFSNLSSSISIATPSAPIVPIQLKGTIIGTSGSWHNVGNTIAKVFDGNFNTFFDAPAATGSWVGLDLGSAMAINQVGFAPRSGYASRMIGGEIQASNAADFSSGTVTLYTITASPTTGKITLQSVATNGGYRYVRYIGPAGGSCNIAELEFFGTAATVSTGFPTNISWTTGQSSPIVRAEAVGSMVNGILYVFGGFDNEGSDTTTIPLQSECDSYNPATNTWTRLTSFPEPFTHSQGVVVGDDIWFVGGYIGNHPGPGTTHVWIYDTDDDTWSRGPDLPQARGAGAAALVGDTIYFTGGMDETRTIDENTTWALNLDEQSAGWQQLANLPNGRNHVAAASLGGYLYVIGGQHGQEDGQAAQSEVDRYDPTTNTWTVMAPLPTDAGKSHITEGTLVYDGRIVVIGGETGYNDPQRYIVDYDPTTNTWSQLGLLPAARSTVVAGIENGNLVVATGNSPSATNTVWIGSLS
jgi:N-acetylneuraminic acid mutarotase